MQKRFNRMPFVISLVAIMATLGLAADTAAAPLTLSFDADGATVDGVSPGGETVWFVRSVTDFSGSPYLSRRLKVLNDDDRDGRVTMKLNVKPASVWVVVDFATGEYVVASPHGSPRQLAARNGNGNGWANGAGHLDFDITDLDVLLVRPGRGAWTLRAVQGTERDGDRRADGNLRIKLSDMERIYGGEATPPVALPHDLLIAIEPTDLHVFVRSAAGGQR